MERELQTCAWAEKGGALLRHYHDTEWGLPALEERQQFECLCLEIAQAGLSWVTILKKRAAYRTAFANFCPETVAAFTPQDIERLLSNPHIIRNRLKIQSCVHNARAFLKIAEEFGSFTRYIWSFIDTTAAQNLNGEEENQLPTHSTQSDKLSKDLRKRGFQFIGTTLIYAHMQAVGIVNGHLSNCPQHPVCQKLRENVPKHLATLP